MYLIDSFSSYASVAALLRTWTIQLNAPGITLTAPGIRLDGSTLTYNGAKLPWATRHIHVGFHFTPVQSPAMASNYSFLHIGWNGATNVENQVGFGLNAAQQIECFTGPNFSGLGGTTVATGATVLSVGTAYWIELDVLIDPVVGSVELRINGSVEFTFTGNTDTRASLRVDYLEFAAGNAAGSSKIWQFTDVLVDDCLAPGGSVWYGPSIVDFCTAAAASAVSWTPTGAASNVLAVATPNATPTTVYNATSTAPAEDVYTHTGITATPTAIHYAQVRLTQIVDAAGTKAVQPRLKVGSSYARLQATVISPTLEDWRSGFLTQPDGSAWTKAALNAALIGYSTANYLKGFNFRQTLAFATDPPWSTYDIGTVYPVTRNNCTFGWVTTSPSVINRSSAGDDRTAGDAFVSNNGTQRTWQLDLPSVGWYQLRLQGGELASTGREFIELFDNAASVLVIAESALHGGSEMVDSGWDLGTRPIPGVSPKTETMISDSYGRWINFASTTFLAKIGSAGSTSSFTELSHLELISFDAGGTATAAPEARVSQLALEVLRSASEIVPAPDLPLVFDTRPEPIRRKVVAYGAY